MERKLAGLVPTQAGGFTEEADVQAEPWTYEEWLAILRGVVVLKAFWHDRRSTVENALGGLAIDHYDYRPQSWPPSVIVASAAGRTEIYLNGTSNNAQVYSHFAGLVADAENGGAIHSGCNGAARNVLDELGHLFEPPTDGRELAIYGHSYGAAVGQILGDKLVRKGWAANKVHVYAVGSLRVFTDAYPAPTHHVELVNSTHDPVPWLPNELVPYFAWELDPFEGWLPGPQLADPWTYKGLNRWIGADGSVQTGYYPDNSGGASPGGDLVNAHFYNAYLARLENLSKRRGWVLDQRAVALLALAKSVPDSAPADKEWSLTTWVPGAPPDLLSPANFLTFFPSKGGSSMASAFKCTAYFRCGRWGWSESYYYIQAGTSTFNQLSAQRAFEKLLGERVKVGHPTIRYKDHYFIDGTRYSLEDSNPVLNRSRNSYLDHVPDVVVPPAPDTAADTTLSDFPFLGYVFKLWAGQSINRTVIMRPLPNLAHMNKDGREIDQTPAFLLCKPFLSYLVASPNWAIKSQDRESNLKVLISNFQWLSPTPNNLTITAAGHGLVPGNLVRIEGGDPAHKPYRGMFRVLEVSGNTFTVDYGTALPSIAGGPTVRKITYTYTKITEFTEIGVHKRDTFGPIPPARGSRKKRA